jgi:hypothetical protein
MSDRLPLWMRMDLGADGIHKILSGLRRLKSEARQKGLAEDPTWRRVAG